MDKEGGVTSFERLASINRALNQELFLHGFSHAVKNPVNSLLLGSKLLKGLLNDITDQFDELEDGVGSLPTKFVKPCSHILESMPQLIEGINDAAFKINCQLTSLLELTGKGAVAQCCEVNINRLVSLCITMMQHQIAEFTQHFSLAIEPDIPAFYGSSQQFFQALHNLLINALFSLPDRSCGVELTASYDHTADQILICVADQGVGILPELQPRITEPFFSTWQEHGCVGLGLTVAEQIIRSHGGKITIESEPGKGTVVLIVLPLSVAEHAVSRGLNHA